MMAACDKVIQNQTLESSFHQAASFLSSSFSSKSDSCLYLLSDLHPLSFSLSSLVYITQLSALLKFTSCLCFAKAKHLYPLPTRLFIFGMINLFFWKSNAKGVISEILHSLGLCDTTIPGFPFLHWLLFSSLPYCFFLFLPPVNNSVLQGSGLSSAACLSGSSLFWFHPVPWFWIPSIVDTHYSWILYLWIHLLAELFL